MRSIISSSKIRSLSFFILLIFSISSGFAKIWLPSILSDHMVLQQESSATIWGWTTSTSETITITGSWNNLKITVKADQGIWSAQLPTPIAGGPYSISIEGHEKILLKNILIGEVWLCSGQSNMEWTAKKGILNAEVEIEKANYPNIRFFQITKHKSSNPQDNTPGNWMECSPETMNNFSSIGYFFGRKLHKDLSIPIGLISSNWGGTPVEVWIPKQLIKSDKYLKSASEKLTKRPWWPEEPGAAYNTMIYPLVKFNIAGTIWYQGESNRQNAFSYYRSFPLLIKTWREKWNKEFPFYFVQIAPFKYNSKTNIEAAIVRDAQLYTMNTVPNTGMVVTNDIGDLKNIHPKNKQEVGRRLALWALAKTYGVKKLEFSGPLYKYMEIKKNKIIISFDHAKNGLQSKEKVLNEFYIAGADQIFYPAKAKIDEKKIIVSSSKVKKPVAVRFAFSNTALPNLFNKEGLPASAFRTDDWDIKID